MARIQIESMTLDEKLEAMELLWDDLCRRAEAVESPQWHKDLLKKREAALARGEDAFEDWEVVKKRIREQLL